MGAFIGHSGGALMVLFVALLALRCAKRLGLVLWPAAPARPLAPRWAPGPGALALAAFGVLAAQFLFAFLCWRDRGQPGGVAAFGPNVFERFTTAGDSPHYLLLAREGYAAEGDAAKYIVFYPLYPLAVRLMHALLAPFSVSWEAAALAVSWLCWGGAGAAMLALAGQDLPKEQAVCAVALLALYPFGFFALGVYTESLFILLSILCVFFGRRRNWPAAGAFRALAALCRNQGLVLLLPLLYLWLRARRQQKQGPASLALALPLLGWGGYLALNWRLFGDPFAFFDFLAAPPWYQTTRWIGANLAQHWQMALDYPGLAPVIYPAQQAIYFIAMALLFF